MGGKTTVWDISSDKTDEISHERTWTFLWKWNLKREIESLLTAAPKQGENRPKQNNKFGHGVKDLRHEKRISFDSHLSGWNNRTSSVLSALSSFSSGAWILCFRAVSTNKAASPALLNQSLVLFLCLMADQPLWAML